MQTSGGPEVINVRVAELRKHGFNSLVQWMQEPEHVYIGRANPHVQGAHQSKWHNPFSLQKYGRQGCIRKYEEYILQNQELLDDLPELKGKVLGCWCAPELCHGHILSRLVAERLGADDNVKEHHHGTKHTKAEMEEEEAAAAAAEPKESEGENAAKKPKTKTHRTHARHAAKK